MIEPPRGDVTVQQLAEADPRDVHQPRGHRSLGFLRVIQPPVGQRLAGADEGVSERLGATDLAGAYTRALQDFVEQSRGALGDPRASRRNLAERRQVPPRGELAEQDRPLVSVVVNVAEERQRRGPQTFLGALAAAWTAFRMRESIRRPANSI